MMARVAAVMAAVGAVAVMPVRLGTVGAQTPATPPALAGLSSCLQQTDRLLVLMLLDESGSLGGPRGTDPDAVRVAGAKAALGGLEILAESGIDGRQPQVEVAAAGFSTGYRESIPWTPVNAQTAPGLRDALETFRDRDRGRDTDYEAALVGAAESLRSRAAALTANGGRAPCLALVWFTDGRYDIEGPDGAAAVEAGVQRLCGGGFVDGMRDTGIVDLVVALGAPQSNLSSEDDAFLRGIASGAGSAPCGSHGSDKTGLFLPASGADDLLSLLGNLFNPGSERTKCSPEATPCAGTFQIGPAASGFRLLVTVNRPDVAVELENPLDSAQQLGPGGPAESTLGSAEIRRRWLSDRALEVNATFPSAGNSDWSGVWTVRFSGADPAEGSFSVAPSARLAPRLVGTPRLSVGESRDLTIELVDSQGRPVDSGAAVDEAVVTAELREGEEEPTPLKVTNLGGGRFRASYETPLDSTATALTVTTRVAFPVGADARLAPVTREYAVPVDLPPVFPRIRPQRLDLPSRRGTTAQRATLTFAGSRVATSCVWISGTKISAPSESGSVRVSSRPNVRSPQRCLSVPRDATRRLEVELEPEDDGSGVITGTIAIGLGSDRTTDVRVVRVPLSYVVEPSPDAATAWLVFVVLLVAGLLFPFLVLHVLNVRWARFSYLDLLRMARIPVVIDPSSGVVRGQDASGTLAIGPGDFETVGGTAAHQFSAGGLRFDAYPRSLRARRRARDAERASTERPERGVGQHAWDWIRDLANVVLGGPFAEVRSLDPQTPIVAWAPGRSLRRRAGGRVHEVPLALPGTWVFVADEDEDDAASRAVVSDYFGGSGGTSGTAGTSVATRPSTARSGNLVAFVSDGGGIEQYDEIKTTVAAHLPGLVETMVQDAEVGPAQDAAVGSPQGAGEKRSQRRARRTDRHEVPLPDPDTTTGASDDDYF